MGVKYKLALCQMNSSENKDESMERAAAFVNRAADVGAKVISLPEMWNSPYDNSSFEPYSEPEDGPSVEFMSDLAKNNEIFLIGGSIPERDGDNLYNTSYIFGPDGVRIGKHRKIHLFDIDVQGGVSFRESDTLSGGDAITIIDTDFGKIGVAICFDVRFPYIFEKMAHEGVHLVLLPASFSITTGPVHWDILMRSRALDNQLYFAACSPARDVTKKYKAYGHSCIVDPWGEFCGIAALGETIVYGDIDLDYMQKVREEIPIGFQKTTPFEPRC
jgi:predicted amidohydrolase